MMGLRDDNYIENVINPLTPKQSLPSPGQSAKAILPHYVSSYARLFVANTESEIQLRRLIHKIISSRHIDNVTNPQKVPRNP